MAILEKDSSSVVDDTEPLTCIITGTETVQSHTVFIVKVYRGPSSENAWQVRRRYSDFVALYDVLKISGIDLALPPKRLLGNLEREFVAERQTGLQKLIDQILANRMLAGCVSVKRFFDGVNYRESHVELSLQYVSMFLRSEPEWEMIEPMQELGCRIRKCFFLVKRKDEPKERWLLSWIHFGPDRLLPSKHLAAAMKLLPNIQHPSVYPVAHAVASDNSVLTIRPYHKDGSIRDVICKAKPVKIPFLKRYCSPKSVNCFSMPQVRQYGRQILEAVQFLHDKGLAVHHLHAGNIVIEKEVCKLVDIENYFVGVPPYYKPFYSQFRKIHSSEAIDVYSFGQLLYEMVYGRALSTPTIDTLPLSTPALIRSVLESILSVEACKNGLPTLEALLSHTLFADETVITVGIKPQLKIPSKLKEAFKEYKENQERRLKEEQKLIYQARRLTKVKAHLGSDEERRRRKLEARKKQLDEVHETGVASPSSAADVSSSAPETGS